MTAGDVTAAGDAAGAGAAGIVTIHQPEHLPWLGFFAKMARAELFVALDCVPFRKNYVQNRNRVLGADGLPAWLTVPVRLHGHLDGRIADVAVAPDARWREKYLRTLEQRYRGHAHFQPLYEEIAEVVAQPCDRMADLNLRLIALLARRLHVRTPVVRASELGCTGTRSELLAAICARVGAATYLSGPSGRDYLDPAPFEAAGIALRVHDYVHPVYPQRGADPFVSHLSAVDLLFNLGNDAAATMLLSGSRIAAFARAEGAVGAR